MVIQRAGLPRLVRVFRKGAGGPMRGGDHSWQVVFCFCSGSGRSSACEIRQLKFLLISMLSVIPQVRNVPLAVLALSSLAACLK